MEPSLQKYLLENLQPSPEWAAKMEKYAVQHNVPIMEPLGIDFLMQLVRIKQPAKILEIGTAIGYSALRMAEAAPQAEIVTIERDEERHREAVYNISSLNKQNNIQVILGDALEKTGDIEKNGPYDLIFIDAAKGQYQRFFELYSSFLNEQGIIVSDNVLFKGLVANDDKADKRFEKIANKIRIYNEWLLNHASYKTTIIPVGDGVAVSVKKDRDKRS